MYSTHTHTHTGEGGVRAVKVRALKVVSALKGVRAVKVRALRW
jgi:hypothetical protein